jgi:hypothetical protein
VQTRLCSPYLVSQSSDPMYICSVVYAEIPKSSSDKQFVTPSVHSLRLFTYSRLALCISRILVQNALPLPYRNTLLYITNSMLSQPGCRFHRQLLTAWLQFDSKSSILPILSICISLDSSVLDGFINCANAVMYTNFYAQFNVHRHGKEKNNIESQGRRYVSSFLCTLSCMCLGTEVPWAGRKYELLPNSRTILPRPFSYPTRPYVIRCRWCRGLVVWIAGSIPDSRRMPCNSAASTYWGSRSRRNAESRYHKAVQHLKP